MKKIFFFLLLIVAIISSCSISNRTSTIVSVSYDETKDKTTYLFFPYGDVIIPGKWEKSTYLSASHQQFFINNDSTSIAIAKGPKNKFEFYSEEKNDTELVSDFYKWDSEYWKDQGRSIEKIEENITDNFIIWKVKGDKVNNIFLFGLKDNLMINYLISSKKWNEEKQVEFIKNLYKTN